MSVWHEPLGVDFSAALVEGLRARMAGEPPEAMAATVLLLPTRRMQRRVTERLVRQGAAILPQMALVSDLSPLLPRLALPPSRTPLALRLRLVRLVDRLLTASPDLGPRRAAFDLAESLGALVEEMQEEGVTCADLDAIDVGNLADHWQASLRFLRIAADMIGATDFETAAGRQETCLACLEAAWEAAPPPGRVIVAGSTGSRGQTQRLMRRVADLPNGDVVLPGLDTDMPPASWEALGPDGQDHPQYRHRRFLGDLGLTNRDVAQWSDRRPVAPARNALMSLALRPPPATHAWLSEGPALAPQVAEACAGLTLVEAETPLAEAAAIALRLREAVEAGTRAALISPDRTLSRQVAACLDRWGVEPDDSAGRPLDLSPPGRLMVQVARLRGQVPDAEALVALLKHPLTHSQSARNEHLRHSRDMELGWLRGGPAHPDATGLRDWAAASPKDPPDAWIDWLAGVIGTFASGRDQPAPMAVHAADHRALLERVAQGSDTTDPPTILWDRQAGRAAREVIEGLEREAGEAGDMPLTAEDYARLLESLLAAVEVREPERPHPGVMIWGALEARVQGADLVILGGLNDATWPALPNPDMWMSRAMRAACGLRAPERAVGLSAHDFQQAVAGREVWLTRATRTADSQTVPSRWLNRLTNLLGGIGPEGTAALDAMRARGDAALATARLLDTPDARHDARPALRPAPVPPVEARPTTLSVTAVEQLIRDPYAIYARHVLRLAALDPLRPPTDAALRGSVVHAALARLHDDDIDEAGLLTTLAAEMEAKVPGAATRALWLGRFGRIAADFATQETKRRAAGTPVSVEEKAQWPVPGADFTLTARADRIDDRGTAVAIFDYKTGSLPTKPQQDYYAKQLVLEALMVEAGAFETLGHRRVEEVAYLGIGGALKESRLPIDDALRADLLDQLRRLIARYAEGAPYPARLAPEFIAYEGTYDQLARFGEWDDTSPVRRVPVP